MIPYRFPSKVALLALATSMVAAGQTGLAQQDPKPRVRPKNPALAQVEDVAGLPRVLVLGDSISIGYTLPLRAALEGVANLHRPGVNCASTQEGVANLDKWLGTSKWDVIHFNFGLHDLKHVDAKGKLVSPEQGKIRVPLEEYEKNLTKIVKRLQQTGAVLIWRPTTPVPPGAAGRIEGAQQQYNEVAARVVKQHGVLINDMNGPLKTNNIPFVRPDNVHFSREGSSFLAQVAAQAIKEALAEKDR